MTTLPGEGSNVSEWANWLCTTVIMTCIVWHVLVHDLHIVWHVFVHDLHIVCYMYLFMTCIQFAIAHVFVRDLHVSNVYLQFQIILLAKFHFLLC